MSNNSFSENCTFYEIIPKNMVETEGPQMTSQCGAYALRAELARAHVRTHMHTSTRPGTHMHARAHTRTSRSNACCFLTATMFRERASMLRYTYIACLVQTYLRMF
jgi:cyclophilin family peptidyl-prolyl cis-trans isomerase